MADRVVDDALIAARAAYIQRWTGHLDAHFEGRIEIADRRILVIGSGWGSEVLWLLRKGAREVVGVDPIDADRRPLDMALAEQGLADLAPQATLLQGTVVSLPGLGRFDHVMSNNVFEHVADLSANLRALAGLLPDHGGRIRIFADPLFYSAQGHHLPVGPWQHLTLSQADLRKAVGPHQWRDYRTGLNGMTATGFLEAVREAGLIALDFSLVPDRQIAQLSAVLDALPPGLKPFDLACEGIACTLAFPHNL